MNTTTQLEMVNVNVQKIHTWAISIQVSKLCKSWYDKGSTTIPKGSTLKRVEKRSKHMKSIEERFSEKVNKTETCHEWTSCIMPNGYGQFSKDGKAQYAHRVAYEMENGKIEDGLYVLHKCDNRKCVNPEHLFLGTFNDNMNDMTAKKRQAHGENNGHSKLKDNDIRKIREMSGTQKEIAELFGVTRSLISLIKNRKIWKYV